MNDVYAFDLKLVCGGYAYFSTDTLGSAPDDQGLEFRTPSPVISELFSRALEELGQTYTIINDTKSLYEWTCFQGWALVDISFAYEHMPHWLRKKKCLISPFGSFTDIALASDSVRKRTFRGKFKKRILDRDNNQCVICSSTENLTLQHVVPYSKGGETSYRNLVTLCEPCNQKLGSDCYRELFRLAGLKGDYEPSLVNKAMPDDKALIRAVQFSSNIMHTRCDLY
ncbi:HNH endonuclease [Citrobacter pasteurii]|uniref:HNH endonuclease n=1 Tax=Citrobacter pasteurii TaxID=1563222 RepID=A0A6N6K8L4_9ENTR|nr:HNH endonuclease [Citrobacter pasteurii]KAA1280717.1 HNH endonuclease [Citrobacter pasteurii]